MSPLRVAAALLLAATSLAAQSPGPADEARAAWRYRRDVAVPEGREGGFVVDSAASRCRHSRPGESH